ncbi:hypothetical protein [Sphingobacterium siyangense]|uniref:hypothetical protein n=1 Tax=Sphingobacterium siyangense TaxID=459529 RepID=UPI003DA38011
MASSTDLYTIRNYSQGTTFKDVAIRGRSVNIASSVAVLFKRVDEYPTPAIHEKMIWNKFFHSR